MNQPILCCLKIKPATLFIGIADLMMHMMVLATLFAAYSHPTLFDHYYSNSISLLVSPSSSIYPSQTSNRINNNNNINNELSQGAMYPGLAINAGSFEQSQTNIVQGSNKLNVPFLWQLQQQQQQQKPMAQIDSISSEKITNIQPSGIVLPKDKSLALLVTLFSTFITTLLIYGILRNKGNLLMPYFSIKVFQVVMACLTTLGFYNCLPNVRYWIETHRYFPMKKELLLLENQTLELFVFSILISSVLIKLYIVIIVWYCYRYMITIESFRHMNNARSPVEFRSPSVDELNNTGFKADDEPFVTTQPPPKYDDIVKHPKVASSPTVYSSQAQASIPTSSTQMQSNIDESTIVPLVSNSQPPSYASSIIKEI